MEQHIPVLKDKVIDYLVTDISGVYLDMTFGGGGHTEALLEKLGNNARIFVIDADKDAYLKAKKLSNRDNRVIPLNGNFEDFDQLIDRKVIFDGVLADLGLSMYLLRESNRGFTFQGSEPLDMRFSPDGALTAYQIINSWKKRELEEIFSVYGEERFAGKIAERIVVERKKRKIETTEQLVEIVKQVKKGGKINPATKIFQALRIAVNRELDVLENMLKKIVGFMNEGGRLLIISYHSLEDRIVKNYFRDWEREGLGKRVNKKVIMADNKELRLNPASRSAKLRIFEFGRR